jgi:hypothetical protein
MTSFYTKQILQIVSDYRSAGGAWPARKAEIVEWALLHERWQPSREDIRRMCGDALVEAMRQETFIDESGRTVRSKLPAKTTRGDGEQGTFWDDLRTAPVEFVRLSVAQRRNGIVAECYHLHNTVRYFNEHHGASEQIELSLEFMRDVNELNQPVGRAPKGSSALVVSGSNAAVPARGHSDAQLTIHAGRARRSSHLERLSGANSTRGGPSLSPPTGK